jgi:hypothetical protein
MFSTASAISMPPPIQSIATPLLAAFLYEEQVPQVF